MAPLNVLAELCLPFVSVGGVFLPMKTGGRRRRSWPAAGALAALGARVEDKREYQIEGMDRPHQVLVIRKTAPTPEKYPRRYAKIAARPLRAAAARLSSCGRCPAAHPSSRPECSGDLFAAAFKLGTRVTRGPETKAVHRPPSLVLCLTCK